VTIVTKAEKCPRSCLDEWHAVSRLEIAELTGCRETQLRESDIFLLVPCASASFVHPFFLELLDPWVRFGASWLKTVGLCPYFLMLGT
jgi:hypothetical protein